MGSVVALIPARGGSKRLSGKNLTTVGGRSLVARAAEVAQGVTQISVVVVSTDEDAIAHEAEANGAGIDRRPEWLGADDTSTDEVVHDFLERHSEVSIVVVLQPTSPLRVADDVVECLEPVRSGMAQSTTSICLIDHPVEWIFDRCKDGRLDPILGWHRVVGRSQEARPAYRLTGAVYCVTREHMLGGGRLVGPGVLGIAVPAERSVDIDTALDLEVARALHRLSSAP